ncbi:BURP domain-containing protein 6 [Elaeis guineensis]|uniref:BURP domain-containing protein 6 isoform X2 n=1 Tax=Elaeis guineensis var. tenera TaxID=51953 RepID=A0A6J0PGM0_ELAGV|nr:BURP domain-containing protein 6 isoform X2 [Elaeis guineensis]
MDHLLPLLSILVLAVGLVTHAASPSELYWRSVLPHTPMPNAIADLIKHSTNVGELALGDHPVIKPMATSARLRSSFFLENDLHAGAKFTLHFTGTGSRPYLLTRREADSIPFTTTKLPEILARFSIEPGSHDAKAIETTLEECEEPSGYGQTKKCATSLESMLDFTTSALRTRDIDTVSTRVGKEDSSEQQYNVVGVRGVTDSSDWVVCHVQPYAYAVFYCHTKSKAKAYMVSMVGEDGTKVEALAVCHDYLDSSNPKILAFQGFKPKRGTGNVCHFLPQDNIALIPKSQAKLL